MFCCAVVSCDVDGRCERGMLSAFPLFFLTGFVFDDFALVCCEVLLSRELAVVFCEVVLSRKLALTCCVGLLFRESTVTFSEAVFSRGLAVTRDVVIFSREVLSTCCDTGDGCTFGLCGETVVFV